MLPFSFEESAFNQKYDYCDIQDEKDKNTDYYKPPREYVGRFPWQLSMIYSSLNLQNAILHLYLIYECSDLYTELTLATLLSPLNRTFSFSLSNVAEVLMWTKSTWLYSSINVASHKCTYMRHLVFVIESRVCLHRFKAEADTFRRMILLEF